jgi:hypothetical protein
MMVSRIWFYVTWFVIVQVSCCPILMVPVAVNVPTFVQSPEKVGPRLSKKEPSVIGIKPDIVNE